jgi:hypothetical protein
VFLAYTLEFGPDEKLREENYLDLVTLGRPWELTPWELTSGAHAGHSRNKIAGAFYLPLLAGHLWEVSPDQSTNRLRPIRTRLGG